jgi:zinc protease
MIKFTRRVLDNGLKVIVHRDNSTPLVVVSLLYDVGSKDENEGKTGLAHLLEHLMFGGSLNIRSYDREVQKAGGKNNAFTSNDITNYYIQLPAANLETGLWLESDRMLGLNFTQKGLEIQKSVVIEEYKQRYLNQPYGDTWLLLRPLAYKNHPYRWPVIGSDISHIQNITLNEIRQFHNEYYCPSNAILSITGNIDEDHCLELASKWFSTIEKRKKTIRNLPAEPTQTEARKLEVTRNVPYHEVIRAFHMCSRGHPDYYTADLISDLLAGGKSSRLYRKLVMDTKLFSNINSYITGDIDPGLFIIKGRLSEGVEMVRGQDAILKELEALISQPSCKKELDKVKNKLEATRQYTYSDILNKATDLGYYELMGNAAILNDEIEKYKNVNASHINELARSIFNQANSSTLLYYSNHKYNKNWTEAKYQ